MYAIIVSVFDMSVEISSSSCKPAMDLEYRIVELTCTYVKDEVYSFRGVDAPQNVKRIVFNTFGESSAFVVTTQGELREIVVKHGSQRTCSRCLTLYKMDVEITIQGEKCVGLFWLPLILSGFFDHDSKFLMYCINKFYKLFQLRISECKQTSSYGLCNHNEPISFGKKLNVIISKYNGSIILN